MNAKQIKGFMNIHKEIVADVPALKRNRVWCIECGRSQRVDSAHCMAHG